MKITKWIDIPSMEIDIHISGEEAVEAVVSDPGDGWTMEGRIKQIVNGVYSFFKHVSDEQISALGEPVRNIIAKGLREQAERFVPSRKEPS